MVQHKREKLARFGIATKGFVYCVIGLLTTLAAFNLGGDTTGSDGVFQFLSKQPFGKVLLGVTALGLIGFVFWRLYQTFFDHENKGNDTSGIVTRLGFATSAIFYGFLAFSVIKRIIGAASNSGGSKQSYIQELLKETYGQIIICVIALGFLGKAIFQFYRAYSERFRDKIHDSDIDENGKKALIRSGKIGFTARGIVIAIISFLLFKAAYTANSQEAGGKVEAFKFLKNEFGAIVLGVVALGLLAYGVFMILLARYRRINID
tara:strand:- start:48477 stop:49265 length:789 start_codon:yes stop_codon:yes gene_type:complete